MTSLQERLFAMQDKQYAAFQAKLTPGVPMESFIGIRVPVLRKFAKEFTKEAECKEFLHQLPHEYYDENMLHGLLISEVKDYEGCIQLTDSFLPFVDNWAVCDIMSPKVFAKHKKELLAKIKTWSKWTHVYTCRFDLNTLDESRRWLYNEGLQHNMSLEQARIFANKLVLYVNQDELEAEFERLLHTKAVIA